MSNPVLRKIHLPCPEFLVGSQIFSLLNCFLTFEKESSPRARDQDCTVDVVRLSIRNRLEHFVQGALHVVVRFV